MRKAICSFYAFLLAGALVATHSDRADAARAEIKRVQQSKALYELPRKSLYALGTADDGSVITVLNGNISSTRVGSDQKLFVDDSIKTKTSSLFYTNVSLWTEIPLPKDLKSISDLQNLINKALKEFGYENPGIVPFLIKGKVAGLRAHVKTGTNEKRIDERNPAVLIFGFFTKSNPASADGPHFSTEMHVIVESGKTPKKFGAVVDDITFGADTKAALFLPR